MEKRPKSENELIQEGLERFLEQELRGVSLEREQKKNTSESKREQDLQVIMPNEQWQKPSQVFVSGDIGGLDLDFDEPVSVRSRSASHTGYNERTARNSNNGRKSTGGNSRNNSRNNRKPNNDYNRGRNKGKNMSRKEKNRKKRFSGLKKFAVFVAVLFLVIVGVLYSLVGSVYKKMDYEKVDSYATAPMKEDGVINILLIGNDSRENGEDGRSDAMILVSISDKTKTVTMTSLLRDMYVEIPGYEGNRLNAAYSYGGPELLMQTIEQNFDIPVHRYALVNFQAFAGLVDAVGGVDLELTSEEVQYVNGYLVEYNMLENRPEGTDYLDTSLSGMIHLNGPQALAYTRNRYIGTDFGRTERQRKVLEAVMKKMPATLATNSSELIDELFPNLTTNLTQGECFNLSLNASKLLTYEQVQQAIPAEGTYSNATIRSMSVLEVDFEANKKILKETIYGE
ncbi:MAG: LCP family protein [Lachnospiraceae bacterium]|nr:LCP family protein [Lachnospiraceae bacterium]